MRVTEIDEVLVAENRVGAADAVEVGDHRLLDVEPLENRLDHDVAVGEIVDLGGRRDAGERRVLVGGRDLAARGEPLEALLDRPHAAADRRFADVLKPHRIARRREGLRDPRPHRPGAHHADFLDAFDHRRLHAVFMFPLHPWRRIAYPIRQDSRGQAVACEICPRSERPLKFLPSVRPAAPGDFAVLWRSRLILALCIAY